MRGLGIDTRWNSEDRATLIRVIDWERPVPWLNVVVLDDELDNTNNPIDVWNHILILLQSKWNDTYPDNIIELSYRHGRIEARRVSTE